MQNRKQLGSGPFKQFLNKISTSLVATVVQDKTKRV